MTSTQPTTPSGGEEALMTAYAAGDARAFERLFATLAPRVHAFFLRCFGAPSVADDLMQATFLKIHNARASYDPSLPLRPWVFTIAARVRLDELRRRQRRPEDGDDETLALADRQASLAADRPHDEVIDERAVARTVRAALDRLPDSQRAVVHLHRYEGLGFAEIAQALGTTEGAVKLRAFRAYETLRETLRPLAPGAADDTAGGPR